MTNLLTVCLGRAVHFISNIVSKRHVLFQQVYPCSNDKECSVGSYCHSPQHAPSHCLTCRRRKKRCHRDPMCCPGNRCSNCMYLYSFTLINSIKVDFAQQTERNGPAVFSLNAYVILNTVTSWKCMFLYE